MQIHPNQKIEIAHDILAREVYARIDATEKMRLKVAQFLRDHYDRYHNSKAKVLLDKKDLDYIRPYLSQVQLSPEQEAFINESRNEVRAKARRIWRRTLAAALMLTVAAIIAIFYWWQAAQAFKELIKTKEIFVDKLIVEAKRLIEEQKGGEALSILNNAKEVLPGYPALKEAFEDLADEGIENAGQWFENLRYDDALAVLNFTSTLQKGHPSLKKAYFEILYVYNETHQFDKVAKAWSQAPFGNDGPAFSNGESPLLQARENLRKIDPQLYLEMQAKYYPEMVLVPGGTFVMGCTEGRGLECKDYEKAHKVSLDSFWMARTETTVWQYFLYLQARGRERPKGTGGEPAAFISWFDAVDYANWVSKQMGAEEAIDKEGDAFQVDLHSSGYRLPTEAEWEYAARGGQASMPHLHQYAGGNSLDSVGWYYANSGLKAHPVKQKGPNELGLYDMSGNLWEWCWDWSHKNYYRNGQKNPAGWDSGAQRVLRGGSWAYSTEEARCFHRDKDRPKIGGQDYGFRLARGAGTEKTLSSLPTAVSSSTERPSYLR